MYTTRRGRPQKAVKKMLEEAINPQGVSSPNKAMRDARALAAQRHRHIKGMLSVDRYTLQSTLQCIPVD